MSVLDAIRRARDAGDPSALVAHIPYAAFMGISMKLERGELIGTLAFAEHLVGNASIPALHGGALGALLESTAIFALLWEAETVVVPKTINITIEYLRSAKTRDTFARADITRQGKRVAAVRAVAWQEDPRAPVAAVNAHFLILPAED